MYHFQNLHQLKSQHQHIDGIQSREVAKIHQNSHTIAITAYMISCYLVWSYSKQKQNYDISEHKVKIFHINGTGTRQRSFKRISWKQFHEIQYVFSHKIICYKKKVSSASFTIIITFDFIFIKRTMREFWLLSLYAWHLISNAKNTNTYEFIRYSTQHIFSSIIKIQENR